MFFFVADVTVTHFYAVFKKLECISHERGRNFPAKVYCPFHKREGSQTLLMTFAYTFKIS